MPEGSILSKTRDSRSPIGLFGLSAYGIWFDAQHCQLKLSKSICFLSSALNLYFLSYFKGGGVWTLTWTGSTGGYLSICIKSSVIRVWPITEGWSRIGHVTSILISDWSPGPDHRDAHPRYWLPGHHGGARPQQSLGTQHLPGHPVCAALNTGNIVTCWHYDILTSCHTDYWHYDILTF